MQQSRQANVHEDGNEGPCPLPGVRLGAGLCACVVDARPRTHHHIPLVSTVPLSVPLRLQERARGQIGLLHEAHEGEGGSGGGGGVGGSRR